MRRRNCIWCSTQDSGEGKRPAGKKRHTPAKAVLPTDDPRFCTAKCAAEFGCAYATNTAFPWYLEWCEDHDRWHSAGEYAEGDMDDCPGCVERRDILSAADEAEHPTRDFNERCRRAALAGKEMP